MAVTKIARHFVELITPNKHSSDLSADLQKFRERYSIFNDSGCIVSITDNPSGQVAFTAPEAIDLTGVSVDPSRLMVHVNAFHYKDQASENAHDEQNLDVLLSHVRETNSRYLLCVTGSGNNVQHRLTRGQLGFAEDASRPATSIDLIHYVKRVYNSSFELGVAYNQYEPVEAEIGRLMSKIKAGATFVVTQPVMMNVTADKRLLLAQESLDELVRVSDEAGVQVVLEAWMSAKMVKLLQKCIGHEIEFGEFDPEKNLVGMHNRYPERMVYFSLIYGRKTLARALEIVS